MSRKHAVLQIAASLPPEVILGRYMALSLITNAAEVAVDIEGGVLSTAEVMLKVVVQKVCAIDASWFDNKLPSSIAEVLIEAGAVLDENNLPESVHSGRSWCGLACALRRLYSQAVDIHQFLNELPKEETRS